jgi:2-dehydropantoate 2-reductase
MRICVIGAGAMGSIYGGLLARRGEDVLLIDSWPEHVAAIARDGLRLDGITGELTIEVAAACEPPAEGFADLALIQTDTNNTAAAAETAKRVLKADGFAVTLQNGIGNLEILCAKLGEARVAGGLTYHSGAVRAPGHVSHTHAGPTWLGELDGHRSARVDDLAARLAKAGFAPTVVDNIVGTIWTKFVHNCAVNPVCAATGLRVGEIPRNRAADALQTRIIEEALEVVAAKGVALVDPDPMASIKAFCRKKFNKPSMLQHMEAGRRTEIDALNGALVREGQALGLATPYNQAIAWLIEAMQSHRMQSLHGPAIDYEALEREAQALSEAG